MPIQRSDSRKTLAATPNHRSYRQLFDTLVAPDMVTSSQLPRTDVLLPSEPKASSSNNSEVVAKQDRKLTYCRSYDSIHYNYDKDSKVVISVTVQGSPGPVRTMVKLGMTVEDTINHVLEKYHLEGRSPMLKHDASSPVELHISHFSLQSLNRSDMIGDVGARSFYLRKDNNDANITEAQKSVVSLTPENVEERIDNIPASSLLFSPADSVLEKLKKITGVHKLRKIFGCLHCE